MTKEPNLQTIYTELETAAILPKCQQCGCMESTLQHLTETLPTLHTDDAITLGKTAVLMQAQMRPIQYACLGCDHCYPAVAQNAFDLAFPELSHLSAELSCNFQVVEAAWPPVIGEYVVLNATSPVAVSTLANVQLADDLAQQKPEGLAIVGKTETENIGIDKIIKNMTANPSLRYLIVAGTDAKGHYAGQTLLALAANGVDQEGRVIDAPGKRPILRNVTVADIQTFRERIQIVDMMGCENPAEIVAKIQDLSQQDGASCGCCDCGDTVSFSLPTVPTIVAAESEEVIKLDKAGYFVIVPLADKDVINIEHYAYDNTLLRTIEAANARESYLTIINNGWVTELSHAAYLGKELAKAELSLAHGFKYIQDGA
jgi:tetrahydromethanopterin S-methyltransferase subunit A